MSGGALESFRRWLARTIAPAHEPEAPRLTSAKVSLAKETPDTALDGLRAELKDAKQELRREKKRGDAALREQKRLEERVQTLSAEASKPRPSAPATTVIAAIAKPDKQSRDRDKKREEKQKAREALIEKLQAKVTALEVNVRVVRAELEAAEKKLAELPKPIPPPRESAPITAGRDHPLEVHFSPGETCLQAILDRLNDAERTIDICVFTITDDRIARTIVDAHRRKVRVRVITDNDKANDEGSDVWNIERAGVAVRVDRTEFHMHHKFAVFDGRSAITGSYNWTRGAARNNEENLVVSGDPRLAAAFSKEFDALWKHLGDD